MIDSHNFINTKDQRIFTLSQNQLPFQKLYLSVLFRTLNDIVYFKEKIRKNPERYSYKREYQSALAWLELGNIGEVTFDQCLHILSDNPSQAKIYINKIVQLTPDELAAKGICITHLR